LINGSDKQPPSGGTKKIMDAFEEIVGRFLESKGYWVKYDVKVNITKQDKREIGLPSMPRPEIDVVGFNVKKREVILIEAKSYLDSLGVKLSSFIEKSNRYRLLTDSIFQRIVTERLMQHYLDIGLIAKSTKPKYGLVAGHIYSNDETKLKDYFDQRDWILYTPSDLKEYLEALSVKSYENDRMTMTVKLLMR